jgi:ubiquinone/menaquinone biosynthesis C-methylase UbiE
MVPVDSAYVNRHIKEFLNIANPTRSEKILEVGCGMGKFTFPLLRAGYRITGLDLSGFLLQKLLEYNNNRFSIDLICADVLEIPDSYNQTFDYVIGFFTLHHFHHLHSYFQVMSRVLKPGGHVIFVEPNAFNPLYYFQILFTPHMSWAADRGVLNMRASQFQLACEYANMDKPQIHKYGFFPPFVVNNVIGKRIEELIENTRLLTNVSAFQIVKIRKPLSNEY